MVEIALSTGCFIGHEDRFECECLEAIELANHPQDTLRRIVDVVERCNLRVLSVHAPCPSHRTGLNLASRGDAWAVTATAICDAMEIAKRFEARYVVLHPFYCTAGALPSDDVERMTELRRLFSIESSISEYVESQRYADAKTIAIENLKCMLPHLQREFPRQRLVLENLNPRLGYGGIRFEDLADIVAPFGGDIGICLDIGHLALASAVLGGAERGIEAAGDLIWTIHVHRNFSGRFCIDRRWNEGRRRPGLQEIDTHLPYLVEYRRLDDSTQPMVTVDNSAFAGLLQGIVQYRTGGEGTSVESRSGLEYLLRRVPAAANRVFEFDSRYAPLDCILGEYRLACRGKHPVALW